MPNYSELVDARELVPLVVAHGKQSWPLAVATCLRGLIRQGLVGRTGSGSAIQVCDLAEAANACRVVSAGDFSRTVHPFVLSSAGNAWLVGIFTEGEAQQFQELCRVIGAERTNRRFEFLPIQDGSSSQHSWKDNLGVKSILVSPGRDSMSADGRFARMLSTYVLGCWVGATLNNRPALEDAFHLISQHGTFSIGYSVDIPDVEWHTEMRGAELAKLLAEAWTEPSPQNSEFPPIAPIRKLVADLLPPKAYAVAPEDERAPGVMVDKATCGINLENPSPLGSTPSTSDRWLWPQHRRLFRDIEQILRAVYLGACNSWIAGKEGPTIDDNWVRWSGDFRLAERPYGAFTLLEQSVANALDAAAKLQGTIVAADQAVAPLEQNLSRLDRAVAGAPTAGGLALRIGFFSVVTFWLVFGLKYWDPGLGGHLTAFIDMLAVIGGILALGTICAALAWYTYTKARIHRQLDVTSGDLKRVHLAEVGESLAPALGRIGRALESRLLSLEGSIRTAREPISCAGGNEPTLEANRHKAFPGVASQLILKPEQERLMTAAHHKVRATIEETRTQLLPLSWPEHVRNAACEGVRRRLEMTPYIVWARASFSAAEQGRIWRQMLRESEIPLVGTEHRLEDPLFFGSADLINVANTRIAAVVDLELPFVVVIRIMALMERQGGAKL